MAAIISPYDTTASPQYDKVPTPQPEPLTQQKTARKRAVYYPTGDGKPMAEDMLHRDLMFYAIAALQSHFTDRADVYISGNDFLYYEEGNAQARVSPDCYVVVGAQKKYRPSYKIWEENNVVPAVVFEFTSRKTRKEDTTIKQPLYEQTLGVLEYFQFDPTGDYLKPRLQGQQLQNGRYKSMTLHENRLHSVQLGLDLVVESETLRFWDPVRGEWLRTYAESEAEVTRLRAELEAVRQRQNLREP